MTTNQDPLFKLYKEARTYGQILRDHSPDHETRLIVIAYDGKIFSVCLFRGDVFALTVTELEARAA